MRKVQKSQKQEQRGAQTFGGRTQPRSGGYWAQPGDVKTDVALLEFKRTDNQKQITIKSADLEKIVNQAVAEGKVPGLCFSLNGKNYTIFEEATATELLA